MHSVLLALALLSPGAEPTPKAGVLPLGRDGKPLNLDFETGTLKDWTAEGQAFKGQPIEGDTVSKRRGDNKSDHQGKYWIGGFEKLGDPPTGTLTSVPFKVTHPWASFLVGGGPHTTETCVEIVDIAAKTVIFRASGDESENLKRVAVDLTKLLDKEIQIRIVDKHTGHWGHINFDDFRFHSEKPAIAPRPAVLTPDEYKYAGQPPLEAAKNMTVPAGFKVDLIAGEPDLHQPIAFCWDDRGRLWVVEAYTYPRRNPEKGPVIADKKLGDKILILEDTNGDGTFDKKTVFMEGLNLVSGIEVGFGGVWIGAAPYFLYIPIDKSGDKPAGEPKILLDGWGYQDTHETLNSFIWGPDGWLYGCHGVFTHSRVGKPGTPDKDRQPINAGIWRYHPTKHIFEVFAHGTSNPWGLDYNQHGDFFIEACVIPHLWHIVQGGRYERQAGQHFNPFTYDAQIKTIAKHRHYAGVTPHGGNGKSDSVGGGHAHSGLICYQGGVWPKEYHGKLFMGNLHGHRINVDVVTPKGASYEGDRNPDFLLSHDQHFIIVAIHEGPDGNVYFCDWSDRQVCHRNEPEIWDRTNGRLYRIAYKDAKPLKPFDLQKQTDAELVKLVVSDNEWMSRHARRILQERAAEKKIGLETIRALDNSFTEQKNVAKRLRVLWALDAAVIDNEVFFAMLERVLKDTNEHVRAWTVQLTTNRCIGYASFLKMSEPLRQLALKDKSPVVRRALASAILSLRTHPQFGDEILKALFSHPEDAADHVLPNMYWYAVEQVIASGDGKRGLELAVMAKIPLFDAAIRRYGAGGNNYMEKAEIGKTLLDLLAKSDNAEQRLSITHGLTSFAQTGESLKGNEKWEKVFTAMLASPPSPVSDEIVRIGAKWGEERARKALTELVTDPSAVAERRELALQTLSTVRDPALSAMFQKLVRTDKAMRSRAIRALASYDDKATPTILLAEYANFTPGEKRDAIATLASRATFASALLDAVASKKLPASDIPAETIRQLRGLGDMALSQKISAVWGIVRDTPADRKKLIAEWGAKLNPAILAKGDLGAGRAVYAKVCQQCHTLYGVGGKVGPEITGANRADLGYLLENVFDPSAVIPKEYAATKLDLADGRSITGIVKEETANTLTVVTANETLTIAVKDVDRRTPSALSMMPDDLTKQLSQTQLRDLFAYLRHNTQVPLLANSENAKEFFNGKDLIGWDGDMSVWNVENGEIVGKTKTGLKRNTFLKAPMEVTDFKLSVKVKLSPNTENSGIQFRSVNIEGGEMRGPQADIGKGWWGKLYEESGRGLLVKGDNDKLIKEADWNDYVVEAVGGSVRLWINGEQVADYHNDDKLARRGLIAFQVHSGGPMEVRFKDIKLEVKDAK